jgi:hypothetical protein
VTAAPQAGVTHDIVLDPEGENLGLQVGPGGWQMRQALPFAAKPGTAKPERSFADLTDWSVWEQTTWSHGALQEDFDDDGMYLWGDVDSRFTRQLILPPKRQCQLIGSGEAYTWREADPAEVLIRYTDYRYAQQFECDAETECDYVYMFMGRCDPTSTAYVVLRADNAGEPGDALRATIIIPTASITWEKVVWSTYTLLASTKYWLEVRILAGAGGIEAVRLGYDPGAGYSKGIAMQSVNEGVDWTSFNGDFFFVIQDGWEAPAKITGPFAVFKTDEYVIAGQVYVHDDANEDWDDAGAGLSQPGTDLVIYNGYMYAAQDTGYKIRKTSDGASWSDLGGTDYTQARCFCVHGGMLYQGSANLVRYTSDPQEDEPSWSSAITVGTSEYKILTLVSTQWGIIALKADGGWLIPGQPGTEDRAYRIDALNWSTRPIDDTGALPIPAVIWSDGMLYIAERGGLLRWDGEVATPVGLDLGTGLPAPYAGRVTGLMRHTNFLYLTIGAGDDPDDNMSSLWAYNGGWHKLAEPFSKGHDIQGLGYTTQHTPHRLLMGAGRKTNLVKLPDTSDNPAQYSSPVYAASGNLISSAFAAGLPNADKVFLSVGVHVERAVLTAIPEQAVNVYYRIDSDEEIAWWWLGEIGTDGLTEFTLPVADFTKRQVGNCSKTLLGLGDTSGLEAGDWICINQLYGQIKSIEADVSITLYYPLATAPAFDDWLYPGSAVGKKIWYQLVLTTNDSAKTPVVKGVYVKYRVLLKDKRVWRVVTQLHPGALLRTGQPSGQTVADIRAALWRLARRAQFNCLPLDFRTSNETLSVIISDYSEFLVADKTVEGGGLPEHGYQVTLSLLEV